MIKQILVLALGLVLVSGCASVDDVSYKTTATVTTTANTLMREWMDYKNTHEVPTNTVNEVHALWNDFYNATQVEQEVVVAYKTTHDTNSLAQATIATTAAAGRLIPRLVQLLHPKTP